MSTSSVFSLLPQPSVLVKMSNWNKDMLLNTRRLYIEDGISPLPPHELDNKSHTQQVSSYKYKLILHTQNGSQGRMRHESNL